MGAHVAAPSPASARRRGTRFDWMPLLMSSSPRSTRRSAGDGVGGRDRSSTRSKQTLVGVAEARVLLDADVVAELPVVQRVGAVADELAGRRPSASPQRSHHVLGDREEGLVLQQLRQVGRPGARASAAGCGRRAPWRPAPPAAPAGVDRLRRFSADRAGRRRTSRSSDRASAGRRRRSRCAVTGTPSDQTSGRRWKVQTRPSGLTCAAVGDAEHRAAVRAVGDTCPRTARAGSPPRWSAVAICGSSEIGSAPLPYSRQSWPAGQAAALRRLRLAGRRLSPEAIRIAAKMRKGPGRHVCA